MPERLNLVLFGPYGAGKGTQAQILREKFNMAYFDTGTVLRQNVEDKTELGLKAKEIMDRGDLVPNELIMEIISSWIKTVPSDKNILFDGIPRFLEQAKTFDEVLEKNHINVLRIFIEISKEESIRRQVERRVCQKCQKIFPFTYKTNSCDVDQGELVLRKENDPVIATKRADIFESQTIPVINYYKDKDLILSVDGLKSIESVTSEILQVIQK